jgi:hypothetical protein
MTSTMMDALFIGHNGLGDNLNMIGALRFMIPFYKRIFFIVKKHNLNMVEPFFKNTNIFCETFEENKENEKIIELINTFTKKTNTDLFITGCWRHISTGRITNKMFLEACQEFNKMMESTPQLTFEHDMLISKDYYFLPQFYNNLGLHFNIYFIYFSFPSGEQSEKLYNSVKNYKHLIFLQNKTSCGKYLSINNLIDKYLNDPDAILISNDENIYEKYATQCKNEEEMIIKKNIVKPFVLGNILDYKDIILNSTEIYIIDSCLVSVILPLLKTNKLKANIVRIINRNRLDEHTARL